MRLGSENKHRDYGLNGSTALNSERQRKLAVILDNALKSSAHCLAAIKEKANKDLE